MEKLKKLFKDKNRKIENLVVFLVILVITLIIINTIIKEDKPKQTKNHSYSQSSQVIPMYNESSSKSVTEENDTSGGTRTIEAENNEKSVVTGSDSNPVTRKNN